jgi:hypothetical protein
MENCIPLMGDVWGYFGGWKIQLAGNEKWNVDKDNAFIESLSGITINLKEMNEHEHE